MDVHAIIMTIFIVVMLIIVPLSSANEQHSKMKAAGAFLATLILLTLAGHFAFGFAEEPQPPAQAEEKPKERQGSAAPL